MFRKKDIDIEKIKKEIAEDLWKKIIAEFGGVHEGKLNLRKQQIRLMLGEPMVSEWSAEDAKQSLINELQNLAFNAEGFFTLRDTTIELALQLNGIEWRGLPKFVEQKRKEKEAKLSREYELWFMEDWANRMQNYKEGDPFEVDLPPIGKVYPTLTDELGHILIDWVHIPLRNHPDVIFSQPSEDKKIIDEWKKELWESEKDARERGTPPTEFHMLSTKAIRWNMGLYIVKTREKNQESLRAFIEKRLKETVEEFSGIPKDVIIPTDRQPRRGILGKTMVVPAYIVRLNPEYRRKLIEEAKQNE